MNGLMKKRERTTDREAITKTPLQTPNWSKRESKGSFSRGKLFIFMSCSILPKSFPLVFGVILSPLFSPSLQLSEVLLSPALYDSLRIFLSVLFCFPWILLLENSLTPTPSSTHRQTKQETTYHVLYELFLSFSWQEEKSKDGSVVLKNVTSSSSGRYKCEVSADQTFQTVLDQRELRVFDSYDYNQSQGKNFPSFLPLVEWSKETTWASRRSSTLDAVQVVAVHHFLTSLRHRVITHGVHLFSFPFWLFSQPSLQDWLHSATSASQPSVL